MVARDLEALGAHPDLVRQVKLLQAVFEAVQAWDLELSAWKADRRRTRQIIGAEMALRNAMHAVLTHTRRCEAAGPGSPEPQP